MDPHEADAEELSAGALKLPEDLEVHDDEPQPWAAAKARAAPNKGNP